MQKSKHIKRVLPRWSQVVLGLFLFIALAGNFIANDGDYIISPLIPYSSSHMDADNASYVSPFEEQKVEHLYQRHWLGTDDLGRDVLSGIIDGAWIALWVGLLSVCLALLIGIPYGLLAGYYGDAYQIGVLDTLIRSISKLSLLYGIIYYAKNWVGMAALICMLVLINVITTWLLEKFYTQRTKWSMPLDSLLTKFLEVFKSIPTLIILILLLGIISDPGIISISLCLGFLMWVRIARYIRAEVLALKETGFIIAQKSLGSPDMTIMIKHCLPKAIPPVMVSIIFLGASTILMEATLSFLGLGLSVDRVSWGSMLNESRNYLGAWWMAVFPGICLFLVLAALANESKAWSQKMRSSITD